VESNQDALKGPLGTSFKISLPRKNITERINI